MREILIERDNVTKTRFEEKIKNCEILDLDYFVAPADFAKNVSERLAKRLKMSEKKLYGLLLKREKDSNIIVRPGGALISFHIKGRNKFEIVIVRTKKGAVFSEESPPVHAAFIVVSSHDEKSFYLHSLMWIVQILEKIDFEKNWIKAKNKNELCCIVQSTLKNECREF